MFDKILIANRGEIACRVAATARRLGIRTVAVYSDADAGSRHVAFADEAVRIGPAPARESYLQGSLIIAAARASGARAIHPGYGFLSENEAFATAVADAGLVFIGPPPRALAAMGSKSEAKALMESAAVPLVPGYHGADQDPALLAREAQGIGFPVLIKAAMGGGGKGMRIVNAAAEFAELLASCKREAAASFGDDRVLVEKYLQRPRHVEVQVFADTHGNCLYLFERDCSVQRRHQKVIEEAPAPAMTAERRRAMGEAAVAAARAVGYVGAGTVEFIVDADGTFYFMEMNTRLQVEHPVTEMITGHDLVEWQLRVAAGQALPVTQEHLRIRGHAIEARVYAENPDKGFLPAIGRLSHMGMPAAVEFRRNADDNGFHDPAPVRIDSGVRSGDAISPHYDPMIAKLIVWGEDRAQAIARMRAALAEFHIVGLANNVDFLARLMDNPAFVAADLDTGLIERERERLFAAEARVPEDLLAAACARVVADEAAAAGERRDPFDARIGWRLNTPARRSRRAAGGRRGRRVPAAAALRPPPAVGRRRPRRRRPARLQRRPPPDAEAGRRDRPRGRTRRRRRRAGGTHARQGDRRARRRRQPRDQGHAAAGDGSDENGAHHRGAGRRHGRGGAVRRRRAGRRGCAAGDLRARRGLNGVRERRRAGPYCSMPISDRK